MIIKRICALLMAVLAVFSLGMPVYGDTVGKDEPEKPYEKIVTSSGGWYSERLTLDGQSTLIIAYEGTYAIDSTQKTDSTFTLTEDTALTGIYVPFTNTVSGDLTVTLTGDKGATFGPYKMAGEQAISVTEDYGNIGSNNLISVTETLYSYVTSKPDVLPKGTYTLSQSDDSYQVRTRQSGTQGAFLIKGMHAASYDKYDKAVGEMKALTTGAKETVGEKFDETAISVETPPIMKQALFVLQSDSIIEEIILNTNNKGEGREPGIVAILDEMGEMLYAEQSQGLPLSDIPNGMWAIIPEIILPAGTYEIVLQDPLFFEYEETGDPMFYVNVTEAMPQRFDFTGTYSIALDTYKVSTLGGNVNDTQSSFSLKDFELSVIDKGDRLELVGQYEGMPFSQEVILTEETPTSIKGTFDFAIDLTGLPSKQKITASGEVMLIALSEEAIKVMVKGPATYQREATAEKGADFNTYSFVVKGDRVKETLPPFVLKALGAAAVVGAGNVPGPDNSTQAATGLLFPPLVGVVAHVVTDMIKKAMEKEAAEKAAKKAKALAAKGPAKYSPEWYAKNYPGKTKEQLAMIMLGDAMGNTDEPDADPESMSSDSGSDSNSDSDSSSEGSAFGEEYEGEDEPATEEEPYTQEPSKPLTEEDFMSEEEKAERAEQEKLGKGNKEEKDEQPAEVEKPPKTMTLVTGIDGKTSTYELDEKTGEWVNPETGGVFNQSQYEELQKNLPGNQEWQETEREKVANRDTEQDRQLAKMIADQKKKDYQERIMKKYHVNTVEEANEIIGKMQAQETKRSEKWQTIGNVAAAGEYVATGVGMGADAAVDFLATQTGPLGKVVQAGYKITKSVAGEVADKGYEKASIKGALVKGVADAATDLTDNKIVKGALVIGGETIGNYVAAKPGEEWDGIADGLVNGGMKVGMGLITDKIAGPGFGDDLHVVNVAGNKAYVALKSDGKWLGNVVKASTAKRIFDNKASSQMIQSGVKIGSAALDNYVVKPVITDSLSDAAKNLPKN